MKLMRTVINIAARHTVPDQHAVLKGQGIPDSAKPDKRTTELASQAIKQYSKLAKPVGVVLDVGHDEFSDVYQGEGRNDERSPIESIFRNTSRLGLFAVTVGPDPGREITRLFRDSDFALGAMLDAAASAGAELAAEALEREWRQRLKIAGLLGPGQATMRFSPGYCGWHISGQKKLFSVLQPSDIGIELNDRFLMQPLKSVSGVIAVGDKDIFRTGQDWPACSGCKTRNCTERLLNLTRKH